MSSAPEPSCCATPPAALRLRPTRRTVAAGGQEAGSAAEAGRVGGPDDGAADTLRTPSQPSRAATKRRFRINRLLGRIVPLIILVYVGYTYQLVVFRYNYGHVCKVLGRPGLSAAHLLPAHIGFLAAVRSYLRVFLAHSSTSPRRGLRGRLARLCGSSFEPHDGLRLERGQEGIRACQPDGSPLRCWRDACNGSIRGARTRHCGDCGTCRVGFDHHCAWFDNDVTAPATLRPFVHFLVLIPPLVAWAFAPLLPVAWRHARAIWRMARQDPEIASRWHGTTLLDRPSPRIPFLVAFGVVFSSIAAILATSTLRQLSRGELTIDVERRKAHRRLLSSTSAAEPTDESRRRLDVLEPRVHFSVPVSLFSPGDGERSIGRGEGEDEQKREVVSIRLDEGVWRRRAGPGRGDWIENLCFFLWDDDAETSMAGQWPLSDKVHHELVRRAEAQYRQRQK
ncbi:uncharacterized protein PSFLO_04857 [Pseudozyma flocculosa]|uniref:Palmitoyltransferase n=1 Tax=Pseudozyma flocculosa TaxID=84751 RepID=A0A5C3F5V8_9BASI|nr:uncharacterized protein PSFLO_04857 [Pseudozyma flocculosa]